MKKLSQPTATLKPLRTRKDLRKIKTEKRRKDLKKMRSRKEEEAGFEFKNRKLEEETFETPESRQEEDSMSKPKIKTEEVGIVKAISGPEEHFVIYESSNSRETLLRLYANDESSKTIDDKLSIKTSPRNSSTSPTKVTKQKLQRREIVESAKDVERHDRYLQSRIYGETISSALSRIPLTMRSADWSKSLREGTVTLMDCIMYVHLRTQLELILSIPINWNSSMENSQSDNCRQEVVDSPERGDTADRPKQRYKQIYDWATEFMHHLMKCLDIVGSEKRILDKKILWKSCCDEINVSNGIHEVILLMQKNRTRIMYETHLLEEKIRKSYLTNRSNVIKMRNLEIPVEDLNSLKRSVTSVRNSGDIRGKTSQSDKSSDTVSSHRPVSPRLPYMPYSIPAQPPEARHVFFRDLLYQFIISAPFTSRSQQMFIKFADQLKISHEEYVGIRESIEVELAVYFLRRNATESDSDKTKRRLKIAGAAVGLGTLTALTAGMAAPVFAGGLAALGFAGFQGIAGFIGTSAGGAVFASLFGASAAGLTGWKYSKAIGRLKDFEFHRLNIWRDKRSYEDAEIVDYCETVSAEDDQKIVKATQWKIERVRSLLRTSSSPKQKKNLKKEMPVDDGTPSSVSLLICISGILSVKSDVFTPWTFLADSGNDLYILEFEPDVLLSLGNVVMRYISESFAYNAAHFWISSISLSLGAAILWPMYIIQYATCLDNAWVTASNRAEQAGKTLATVLRDRQTTGHRPINLIGFSMGAKVIYECLLQLFYENEMNLIGDVIVMGLPATGAPKEWRKIRQVVSGSLINVFSRSDWLLGLLVRFMEWKVTVAGLAPIHLHDPRSSSQKHAITEDENEISSYLDGDSFLRPDVFNFDVSDIIKNHSDYVTSVKEILWRLGYHSSRYHVTQNALKSILMKKSIEE